MIKKQNLPESIQKQFIKNQFKPGDAVFFIWLGSKKYGYVTETKERNWGIQYTVESEGTRYPCGIQIKTYKTTYTTGYIVNDETRSLGQQELITRIQTGYSSAYTGIFEHPSRSTSESKSDDTTSKRLSSKNSSTTKSTRTNTKSKATIESSTAGVQSNDSKKRRNNKLDDAIQKQRDFLSGFVKKD